MTPTRWGGFAVLAIVALVATIALLASRPGPCEQAKEAYTVFLTSLDNQTRSTALTVYNAKKAECEAIGGTVEN